MTEPMTKLILLGDTGGHMPPLVETLRSHGVNIITGYIPEDTVIVHAGDIIHKGPDTTALLTMVERFRQRSPGRWVQIMGNHEAQHIGFATFWECACDDGAKALLEAWYHLGFLQVAVGFDNVSGVVDPRKPPRQKVPNIDHDGLLITHAGLTASVWRRLGKRSHSAEEVATYLNVAPLEQVLVAGALHRGFLSSKAGPVWAIGSSEVFPSWVKLEAEGVLMPFHQAFGHTTGFLWNRTQWWPGLEKSLYRERTVLNMGDRATLTTVAGRLLIGVDPGFDVRTPDVEAQPCLILSVGNSKNH